MTTSQITTRQTVSVLGGTGTTGRRVLAQLRSSGHQAREASRRGAQRFDWEDRASWPAVLEGADGLYLLPHEAPGGNERLAALLELAERSGVRRVVLLSAREWADLDVTEALEREQLVRSSRLGWTILRPVWFAQNFSEEPFFSQGIADGQLLHGTGEGRHPFVDVRDIAAVAAAALTEDRHAEKVYTLSGPRALTVGEAVAEIAAATGRAISHRDLKPEAYREHLVTHHYSAQTAEGVVALSSHIRRGQDAYLSDGVQQALGRAALDFSDYIAGALADGGWAR